FLCALLTPPLYTLSLHDALPISYGWMPMDVTTGRLAADKGTGDDPSMEWFYLGGLDNWRIAFNQDWDRPFQPPKQHFRSDDIDSDRKSTRLNSSHVKISYAVFCL